MKPLSNFDIEKMLKKIPGFRGVFASDDLPEKPMLNESGVMNFDVLGNPGTHWVSWICRGGSRPFTVYFDSFGVPIPDTLRVYLNKHPGTHWANSGEIQSMDSVLCGYYCVDFIKACHDASSPMEVIDWLNEYKPWPGSNEKTLIKNLSVSTVRSEPALSGS